MRLVRPLLPFFCITPSGLITDQHLCLQSNHKHVLFRGNQVIVIIFKSPLEKADARTESTFA